jgi:hypothetical protein
VQFEVEAYIARKGSARGTREGETRGGKDQKEEDDDPTPRPQNEIKIEMQRTAKEKQQTSRMHLSFPPWYIPSKTRGICALEGASENDKERAGRRENRESDKITVRNLPPLYQIPYSLPPLPKHPTPKKPSRYSDGCGISMNTCCVMI